MRFTVEPLITWDPRTAQHRWWRLRGPALASPALDCRADLSFIDAHVERIRTRTPWAKVGRSDALRDLVLHGLARVAEPSPTRPEPVEEPVPDVAPVENPPPPTEPPAPAAAKRSGRGGRR